MTVIDTPAAPARRRIRRQLLLGLFRRSATPEWEPAKLPRGVTETMVGEWLDAFLTAKEKAEPWVKQMEQIRALLEDIPAGEYGSGRLRRYKPRRILDQKAARKLIERLGEVVPWTASKPPVKVERA